MNDRFTCEKCVTLLQEFLDGGLETALSEQIEHHLSGCELCVNFVRTYRSASACARKRLIAEEVPPELQASLSQFLKGKVPGF